MKDTKSKDLRDRTVPELEELIRQERASLYMARRDLVFRRIQDTASLKVRRHNIARMMTIITEKQRGSA